MCFSKGSIHHGNSQNDYVVFLCLSLQSQNTGIKTSTIEKSSIKIRSGEFSIPIYKNIENPSKKSVRKGLSSTL